MKDPKELYPLHFACRDGDIDQIKKLIATGSNVNERFREYYNWTPLHFACSTEAIELLLAAGADVNAKDKYEHTILYMASQAGNIRLMNILIAAGADVNAKNHNGWTSLHIAQARGYVDAVEVLLAAGVTCL